MKYVALLRGINVGKNNRIDMKSLRALCETQGYSNVSTYINSGNVIFASDKPAETLAAEIESGLLERTGAKISVLVKTVDELARIAAQIPADWTNDTAQRTDVAYLFDQIDTADIVDELPLRKEFLDVRYTAGALIWHVKRENYNKSQLNKIIGHKLYRYMTIRNVNTARYLAGL
ncbi:MAG: hypothetical protein A2091_08415 [Desulfuromonadales bacterium GWD2_61_12]|nr:MAG: hypothetical protein A2005_01530 [Desulfuromonadales bacterium GWC2_61_20]OGR32606.1 MAG: hypothetical protein A2091_08415 [Desulfuromonadales bacterium GWD2_61_12]